MIRPIYIYIFYNDSYVLCKNICLNRCDSIQKISVIINQPSCGPFVKGKITVRIKEKKTIQHTITILYFLK